MGKTIQVPKTYRVEATATYRDGHVDRVEGESYGHSMSDAMDNADFGRLEPGEDDPAGKDVIRVTMLIEEIA